MRPPIELYFGLTSENWICVFGGICIGMVISYCIAVVIEARRQAQLAAGLKACRIFKP